MRTLVFVRHLIVTLFVLMGTLSLGFAKGKDKTKRKSADWELVSAGNLEAEKTDFVFKSKEGAEVKITDDDGMLALATIQHRLMQDVTEEMFRVMDKYLDTLDGTITRADHDDAKRVALAAWEQSIRFGEMARYPDFRSAILESLTKIMDSSERGTDLHQDASYAHAALSGLVRVNAGQLNTLLGFFLKKHARHHFYRVEGQKEVQNLVESGNESNPLGALFDSRPFAITPEFLEKEIENPQTLDVDPSLLNARGGSKDGRDSVSDHRRRYSQERRDELAE